MAQTLHSFIAKSGLTAEEKTLWREFMSFIDDAIAQDIFDAVAKDNDTLMFLTKNLKEKKDALQNRDHTAWQRIVSEEEHYLKSLV